MTTFLAMTLYLFVAAVTPGPNNMMVLASGVNFGFSRTLPHMWGITLGFSVMLLLVGVGMAGVFHALPALYTMLKVVSSLYMIWLAWKIANSGPIGEGRVAARPFSFLQAALFQWVNPKAWIIAITAVTAYIIVDHLVLNALIIALVASVVTLPSVMLWTGFGAGMRRYLDDPVTLRLFNWTMAALLVASLWPVLAEFLPS